MRRPPETGHFAACSEFYAWVRIREKIAFADTCG